jgi:hypothetical protein
MGGQRPSLLFSVGRLTEPWRLHTLLTLLDFCTYFATRNTVAGFFGRGPKVGRSPTMGRREKTPILIAFSLISLTALGRPKASTLATEELVFRCDSLVNEEPSYEMAVESTASRVGGISHARYRLRKIAGAGTEPLTYTLNLEDSVESGGGLAELKRFFGREESSGRFNVLRIEDRLFVEADLENDSPGTRLRTDGMVELSADYLCRFGSAE